MSSLATGKTIGPKGYFSAREPSRKKTKTCIECGQTLNEEHAMYWGHFDGDHFEFHAHIECANNAYPWTLKLEDVQDIRNRITVPTLFNL